MNAAILLNKYDVFDTNDAFVTELIRREGETHFNINKHLAYKYYTLASFQKETEDEANLKLGDFYYYG